MREEKVNIDREPTLAEKLRMLDEQTSGLRLIRDQVAELVYKINGPTVEEDREMLAKRATDECIIESIHNQVDHIYNSQARYINDIEGGLALLNRSL